METKAERKLKCRLHVGRLSGGGTPDEMRIEVSDELSNVHFLEIRLPPGDLMCAITARSVVCEMTVRALHLVGTKSEVKEEEVKFDPWSVRSGKERKGMEDSDPSASTVEALSPYEVDGWRGRVSDLFNGHRRSERKGFVKVSFHRFIDATTGKPILKP